MTQPSDRRLIGRILSLGFPLPGVRVDNYNLLSSPAIFDYDALVIDTGAVTALIGGVLDGSAEAKTFAGLPVRDESSTTPSSASLGDVLLQRRDETARLLGNGGLVVAFAHPATSPAVGGGSPFGNWQWLGEQAPPLIAGDGTEVRISDHEHPMAAFLERQLANISYRAHVDVARADGARVFAESYGGAAIGVEMAAGNGRLVLLPALKSLPGGDGRYKLSEQLQSAMRRMLGVMAEGRAPAWVGAAGALAGLAESTTALKSARDLRDAAQAALSKAEAAHEELARYQRLLWQEGALGLDEIVFEALKLIGFDLYTQDASAPELRLGDKSAMLEIAASDEAIDMAPHFRLRQRIDRAIERRGAAPRGVLLVNGHRLKPPAERPPQASDALVAAAEAAHYCIATTASLFEAVRAHLEGDAAAVEAYRAALLATDGVLADEVSAEPA